MSFILALVPSLLLVNKTQSPHVGEVQDADPAGLRFNGPCGDVIRVANELESYKVVDRHAVDKGYDAREDLHLQLLDEELNVPENCQEGDRIGRSR
ncbi:hypothetical protein HDU90_003387, partial [Geranomyces variabilis]